MRPRLGFVFACVLACAPAVLSAQAAGIPRDSLDTLRKLSTFAFRARIDSVHASTIPGIPASAHTIAVTPLLALQCPTAIGLYITLPVTVYVDDTTGIAPRDTMWFFGSAWVIGKRLGVRAIARVRATFADSVIASIYLGEGGPRAQMLHHLQDTTLVVTGRVLLNGVRPKIGYRFDSHSQTGVTVPLVVSTVMHNPGFSMEDTMSVAIPIWMVLSTPQLQVPDAYQHLLFILHSTVGQPDNIVSNGRRPPLMFRTQDDILPIDDSAGVASVIAALPTGRLGSRPTNFVAQCGFLPP
jgi:hypothetical protein